ncbi:MAG: O-succinylhomoserine sulfhydrylase [Hydrogenophilaceae bacterium]|jgi:O-succinylhomoserine sulfhydrylase|nr:O-succinylhomoserine sulfhydrylase [Hydrogenophilaceae bacterium]
MSAKDKPPRLATRLVRGGQTRSQHKETAEALFLTSGFVYDSAAEADARFAGASPGYLYGRYANPTVRMFEERLMALEGKGAEECLAVGSGMAAVNAALLANLKAGDRVIGARAMFASCLWILDTLLPRLGVDVELVDGEDLDQWKDAAKKGVTLALIESPSNPMLGAVDIQAVADIVHSAGGKLIVDNVFASPLLQKPFAFGADIVVYSATKHMDGQGRTLAGAILASKELIDAGIREFLRHTGPAISPFNAWVLVKGLETIALRVERQCANAARIANALAGHARIERLYYPGRADHPHHALHARQMNAGGTMIAFDVAGGRAGAWRFLDALELIDISNNLGDAKSLATHPATTTHRRLTDEARARIGVQEGSVRLSVGLEDADDLIEDLLQALEQA